jgi:DNA-binding transcriptional MerR regulator
LTIVLVIIIILPGKNQAPKFATSWHDVARDAEYSLDELVAVANELLPRHLPAASDESDARFREEVNARLVRHLASLGLLDEAGREGREARYGARHLLQLLTTRRLMAEGYTTGAIKKLIGGANDARLEALLLGEASTHASIEAPYASPPTMSGKFSVRAPRASTFAAPAPKSANAALDFLKDVRNRTGAAQSARASPPSTPASVPPSQWRRVEIASNLEVHVRDDFRFPPTPHEREALLNRIADALKNLNPHYLRRKK